MLKRKIVIVLLFCLLLLSSGCSASFDGQNVEDLLAAPKVNNEQADVVDALEQFEGGSVQLEYPISGELASPVILNDFDGDGQEDAAVFYTTAEKGNNVHIALLRRVNKGGYEVVSEREGAGVSIETVALAKFHKGGNEQLVVGYQSANTSERNLVVYLCDQNGELVQEYAQAYSRFVTYDFTENNRDDLVLVSKQEEGTPLTVSLLTTEEGTFKVSSYVQLSEKLTDCNGIYLSMGPQSPIVVLDCSVGVNSLASAAVYCQGNVLKLYKNLGGEDFAAKTTRSNALLQSADIDEDGAIEIPCVVGPYAGTQSATRFLQLDWYDPLYGDILPKYFGVADIEYGYFLKLPAVLQGKTTVLDSVDTRSWQLVSTATGETLVSAVLLAKGEGLTGTDQETYTQVGASGGYRVFLQIENLPRGVDKATILSGFVALR